MALVIVEVQHDNSIGPHFPSTVLINLINIVNVIVSQ